MFRKGTALTLPGLIRHLQLGAHVETHEEENMARQRLVEAAMHRIDELYRVWNWVDNDEKYTEINTS